MSLATTEWRKYCMIRQHLVFCPSGIYAMNTVYILFITPESTGSNVRALAQAKEGRGRTPTYKTKLEGQLV